jgi:hypothetical protein
MVVTGALKRAEIRVLSILNRRLASGSHLLQLINNEPEQDPELFTHHIYHLAWLEILAFDIHQEVRIEPTKTSLLRHSGDIGYE